MECLTRESEEADFVVKKIRTWLDEFPPETICLAARTNSQLTDRYQPLLEQAGIATVMVKRDPESEASSPGIRLATMHRMKGLEFSRVLLAGVQDGSMPLDITMTSDEVSREDHELQERCLLYVASTRARDELAITGFGKPSRFLGI